jgi:hypothetical protein
MFSKKAICVLLSVGRGLIISRTKSLDYPQVVLFAISFFMIYLAAQGTWNVIATMLGLYFLVLFFFSLIEIIKTQKLINITLIWLAPIIHTFYLWGIIIGMGRGIIK